MGREGQSAATGIVCGLTLSALAVHPCSAQGQGMHSPLFSLAGILPQPAEMLPLEQQ